MPPPYAKGHVRRPDKDHLIAQKHAEYGSFLQRRRGRADPPNSWDSWKRNWVPPIRNQQQCGSCWLFSGTRTAMVALVKAGVLPVDGSKALCEQYFLDCGRSGGCNGDDNTTALDWIKSTGFPLESDYGPYDAHPDRCHWKQGMTLIKIQDWYFGDHAGGSGVTSPLDIQTTIMTSGAAGCAVAADDALSNYKAGTVFSKTTSQQIDHDVTLTGWEVTSTRVMGVLSPTLYAQRATETASNGWWWMDNSWGPDWGEKGRMRIAWGINLIGTEAVGATVDQVNIPIDWYL